MKVEMRAYSAGRREAAFLFFFFFADDASFGRRFVSVSRLFIKRGDRQANEMNSHDVRGRGGGSLKMSRVDDSLAWLRNLHSKHHTL